jgi:uncharacterized NAD(P)/FAD-binding protein YdhS
MFELAIIGGGPAAACLLAAVAERVTPSAEVNVTVFEPDPRLWLDRTYAPDDHEIMADVPMEELSVHGWDADHGVRWLRQNGLGLVATDSATPRRSVVGRYIEDTANRAIAAMRAAGSRFQVKQSAVTGLTMEKGKLWLRGDFCRTGPFDQAVLCLDSPTSGDDHELPGSPGFIPDPQQFYRSLADVPGHARVGVVGSGSTAVDAVMALRTRGHQGPITLLSRDGHLPAVRRPKVRHELQHLTVRGIEELTAHNGGLRLEDLVDLATAELAEAGASISTIAADLASKASAVQRLRDDLAGADADLEPAWLVLRDGLIACGQDAWFLLSDQEKERVRTHHHVLMRHYRPMLPTTAAHLVDLLDTGQLNVMSGERAIRPRPGGGFDIDASDAVTVDVVVSATDRVSGTAAQPLLASMEAQGLVVGHRFGGIRVDRTTSRVTTWRGVADQRLHALGGLTSGAYLLTSEIAHLATRADSIAEDIGATVRKGLRSWNTSSRQAA